jgi:hypothetical protein
VVRAKTLDSVWVHSQNRSFVARGEQERAALYFHRLREIIAQKCAKTRWQGLCQGHSRCQGQDAEGHHRREGCADSIVYSDTLKNHINRIENFWNQARKHLRRFNGVPATHSHSFCRSASGASAHSTKNTTNPMDSMGCK